MSSREDNPVLHGVVFQNGGMDLSPEGTHVSLPQISADPVAEIAEAIAEEDGYFHGKSYGFWRAEKLKLEREQRRLKEAWDNVLSCNPTAIMWADSDRAVILSHKTKEGYKRTLFDRFGPVSHTRMKKSEIEQINVPGIWYLC